MKKIIFILFFAALYSIPVSSQITNPWIMSQDTLAYMWPSFLYFQNNYIPANIDGYTIKEFFGKKDDMVTISKATSPNQALALALRIVGDERRYGVTKDMPYIIPHKFGIVMYQYSYKYNRWELFNLETDSMTAKVDFKKLVVR